MSIIYNQADFLAKNIPTTDMDDEHMSLMYLGLSTYVNSNIEDVNQINNNMLELLDDAASLYKNTMRTLGGITNAIADTFVTGGGSRDSINIFNKQIKNVSTGVILDYDTLQVRLSREPLVRYSIKDISIKTRNGVLGNTVEEKRKYFDIENIISSTSRLEIESYDLPLNIEVDIDIGKNEAFNNIKFNLFNFGVRYPTIESISISEDGCNYKKIKISTSNSFSMDVNDFDFKDGMISIHTEESSSRYIKVNLIQKVPYNTGSTKRRRYAIGMNMLELAFYSAVEDGDIIIGPIKSSDEIFKIAAYSDMTGYDIESPNINLYISTDQVTWIPIQNSSVYDPKTELSKIINFNNIDNASFFTEEEVNEIFLRIEMNSFDVSHVSPPYQNVDRQVVNVSSSNRNIPINAVDNKDYINLFKYINIKYASRFYIPASSVNIDSIPTTNISNIEKDGVSLIQGLGIESDLIYDLSKSNLSNDSTETLIQFKYDKVHVTRNDLIENIPTYDFDPFDIELYGFSSILDNQDPIETKHNRFSMRNMLPVIPYKENKGDITLRYGDKSIIIPHKEGFFYDNREYIYAVSSSIDEIILEDQIGRVIKNIILPSPRDGEDIKFFSILNYLEPDMPDSSIEDAHGLKFNELYPLVELKEDEYAVEFGELVFGSYYKGVFPFKKVIASSIGTSIDNNLQNVKLTSSSSKQIRNTYQLKEYDFKTIIKLKDTNILEQSVSFDTSKASVNAFLTEVDFIDGQTEFILKKYYIQTDIINLNSIRLHEDYIDDGEIGFRSCSDVFSRRVYAEIELLDKGDYFIDKELIVDDKYKYTIRLPEDIYTSASNDTEISYSIKPLRRSISGHYSVDHENGVIHTISKVDGNTSVSYKYSSVYAKYNALDIVDPKNYSISGTNLIIETEDEKSMKYLLVSLETQVSDLNYRETPTLLDFNLNTIDARNSI
ncbi:MAG: hypothetical protein DRQ78_00170 [Epsilonproteobacteria bacterium]|nr:MAG: hypothetical protein DRQ78_00170 [Campylobacterota bacterium]